MSSNENLRLLRSRIQEGRTAATTDLAWTDDVWLELLHAISEHADALATELAEAHEQITAWQGEAADHEAMVNSLTVELMETRARVEWLEKYAVHLECWWCFYFDEWDYPFEDTEDNVIGLTEATRDALLAFRSEHHVGGILAGREDDVLATYKHVLDSIESERKADGRPSATRVTRWAILKHGEQFRNIGKMPRCESYEKALRHKKAKDEAFPHGAPYRIVRIDMAVTEVTDDDATEPEADQ